MGKTCLSAAFIIVAALILSLLLLNPCYAENTFPVIDSAGRMVKVPANVRRIICIGPGCLRLICYLGAHDRVVGVEAFEKIQQVGKSYRYALPQLLTLPVIAPGGPGNVNKEPDLEAVLNVKPDVIFTSYMEKGRAETLQQKIGVPVVTLSYGRLGSFGNELYDSLRLAGKILGKGKRAEEIVSFIERAKADLSKRVSGLEEAARPSVFVGAVGYRGVQGIESTETDYMPFDWVRALNVARREGKNGHFFVNREKILAWNPELIFLDALGLNVIAADYRKRPRFYQALQAFRKGRVYILWPFNAYATNVDTVIIDAYATGRILYPERFEDIALESKVDEIYCFFMGKSVAGSMRRDAGPLGARWKP
jgi:iron complex transport system substrate-binding protein